MATELADALRRFSERSNQALPPAVLLHGVEPLLVEEALDQIRAALKQRGFDNRTTYHQDTGFNWQEFFVNLRSQGSLFAQQSIHEVRASKNLTADAHKRLLEYLEDASADDVLIVIVPALDKRQQSAKWVKQFEKAGLHISIPAIPHYQMANWIKQRLQSRSLRVESGVIEVLLENVEGNVLAAAQEIDKLQVLCPDGAVTLETLNYCLADQAKFDAFSLVDQCLHGNHQKARRILKRLDREGIEPVIIVWALVREVRKLAAIANQLKMGISQSEAYKSQQVWRSRESLVNNALRRFSHTEWYELLENLAKLDQSIKGQRNDGVGTLWQQLEQFCCALAGSEKRAIFAT